MQVRGDTTFEPTEFFVVYLGGATGATIADGQSFGRIKRYIGVHVRFCAIRPEVYSFALLNCSSRLRAFAPLRKNHTSMPVENTIRRGRTMNVRMPPFDRRRTLLPLDLAARRQQQ